MVLYGATKVVFDCAERELMIADITKEERITELEGLIGYHNEKYFNQQPEITDFEYDELIHELRTLSPTSAILFECGADPSYGKTIKHNVIMGSLNKEKTIEKVFEFLLKYCKINGRISIMPKIDGLPLSLHYKKGKLIQVATRGNGEVGQDVTDNAQFIKSIPQKLSKKFTGEIRGEAYMLISEFEKAKASGIDIKNPRNGASGLLGHKTPEKTGSIPLGYFAYEIFTDDKEFAYGSEKLEYLRDELKFEVVECESFKADDKKGIQKFLERWENTVRKKIDYEIDGMVISFDSLALQIEAGTTDSLGRYPRAKLAFKFKPEQKKATIVGMTWQVGRTGRITPVAEISPTELCGSTIRRVTVHNKKRLHELDIRIGDEIMVEKAGEIIPSIVSVFKRQKRSKNVDVYSSEKGGCSYPIHCPACESKLSEDATFLLCVNPDCSAQLEERVLHYLQTLECKGIGQKTIRTMNANGLIKSVSDIYNVKASDLNGLEGYGDRKSKIVIDAIHSKKEIDLSVFIRSLGIHGVGKTTSRVLAKRFGDLDSVLGATYSELTELDGIGEITANGLAKWFEDYSSIVIGLRERITIMSMAVGGKLSGKSFCLTGAMSKGRKEIAKMIEDAGGDVKSSVGKGLNFLVMSDPTSGSSKAKKAEKLGTKCISEDELYSMM